MMESDYSGDDYLMEGYEFNVTPGVIDLQEARVFFPAYFINNDAKRAGLIVLDFSSEG